MGEKLTTYRMDEKDRCEKHDCKMVQVPCSMYVYCPHCEDEKIAAPLSEHPGLFVDRNAESESSTHSALGSGDGDQPS